MCVLIGVREQEAVRQSVCQHLVSERQGALAFSYRVMSNQRTLRATRGWVGWVEWFGGEGGTHWGGVGWRRQTVVWVGRVMYRSV